MNALPVSIGWYAEAALLAAVAAPVVLAFSGAMPILRRYTSLLTVLAALPALLCALTVPVGGAVDVSWLVLDTRLGMDATGQRFLLFTALLWLLSALFASGYLARDANRFRFLFGFLLAMGGNFGLILAQDMMSYLVGFALMSFASYSLVVHAGDTQAVRSGRVYIVLVVIGEIFLFSAMILHLGNGGELRFETLNGVPARPDIGVLLILGFGIKAGAILLHVWLPLAHTVAPTPASAVLSGAMIKAGLLGWIRFFPPGAGGDPVWGAFFLAAGLAAAFYGVAVGLGQTHPKTVLAYSSISQMGLITVAFGTALFIGEEIPAATAGVLLYAFHHALAKGALFLGTGIVGGSESRSRRRLWATAALGIAALALAGAPLTSGAAAKLALKTTLGQVPDGWQDALGILLPLAAMGTTVLMGRFFYTLRSYRTHHRPAGTELWAWIALLALAATLPLLLPEARQALDKMMRPASVWVSFWPVAAGAVMSAALWYWTRRTGRVPAWHPPAGDLLVPVESLARLALRLTANLAGRADRVIRFHSKTRKEPADREKPARIEIWEAGFNSWNTSGLIFAGVVCALLFILTWP